MPRPRPAPLKITGWIFLVVASLGPAGVQASAGLNAEPVRATEPTQAEPTQPGQPVPAPQQAQEPDPAPPLDPASAPRPNEPIDDVDDDGSVVAPQPSNDAGTTESATVTTRPEVARPEVAPPEALPPRASASAEDSQARPSASAPSPIDVEKPAAAAPVADDNPTASPLAPARTLDALAHTRVSGLAQADYQQRQISVDELSDGTGEPLNEDAFSLRRARLQFDSDWRWAGVSGLIEFADSRGFARPMSFDVHAQIPGSAGEPPLVQVRAGLFAVPFGFENSDESDFDRFFAERAMLSHAFVPGLFDLGVGLSGHIWALDWALALQNGEPIGTHDFAYRDPNAAKDAAGRLRVQGGLFGPLRAAVGLSGLFGHGFSAGTPPTKDSFEWQDLNEDGRVTLAELIPVPGSAGRPSSNFERWGAAADVQLWADIPRIGELMIYGEAAVGVNLDRGIALADPVLLGRDQRGFGWYAAFRQEIFRFLSVGARYDYYEPNFDGLEGYDGVTVVTRRPFHMITGAISTQLPMSEWAQARLLLEYSHQRNSLGRDAAGRPAQLDNDTLRARLEVKF